VLQLFYIIWSGRYSQRKRITITAMVYNTRFAAWVGTTTTTEQSATRPKKKKKRSNLDENNKYNWSILNIWSLSTTSVLQTPQRRRVHNLRCTWITLSRYPENRLRHRFIRLIEVAMRMVCLCVVVCIDKWKRNGHRNLTGKTRYRADCPTTGGRMANMSMSSWCTAAIS